MLRARGNGEGKRGMTSGGDKLPIFVRQYQHTNVYVRLR